MALNHLNWTVIGSFQSFFPLAVAGLFFVVVVIRLFSFNKSKAIKFVVSNINHRRFLRSSWLVSVSFALEAVLFAIETHLGTRGRPSPDTPIYLLGSLLVWSCLSVALFEPSRPFWPAFLAAWVATFAADIAHFTVRIAHEDSPSAWATVQWVLNLGRAVTVVLMAVWGAVVVKRADDHLARDEEETRSLLNDVDCHEGSDADCTSAPYGSIRRQESNGDDEEEEEEQEGSSGSDDDEDEDEKEIKRLQKQRMAEQGGWVGYLKGFTIFLPYIIPYKDRHAQLWLLIMLVCVSLERVLIVMIPQQLSAITDSLSDTAVTGHVPWTAIIVWGLLRFPGNGMTHMFKDMANTRISQFAYSQLKGASFAHVMGLSMDYHTTKSSGKLVKAIEQGTDLTSIIENVFTVGPMLIDIAIAAVYLTTRFDFYMGYILLSTSLLHIYSNIKIIARTVPIERISSERARVENEVLYDSVTNWPTVAYHNRRKFEQEKYARVVRSHVTAERRYYDWIDYGEALREFVLDTGLVLAAALAAYRISTGDAQVSSFVFLVVYWAEIREPMSQLAWTFRETSAHLINAEWLFQLLQNKPTIQDKPGAKELVVREGRVEFDNVSFFYDLKRPILRDVSFTALPGQSVALVGETGGGKSTVLKLLYRFYDVQGGSITIDGHDLRDVTLDSLRDTLGIVPQDPSVFDQTIMDNVRYARPDATAADVVAACKAAQIHDQIMTFPDGYSTRLGERGIRLSGGELQRVAIARVILRKPRIVVLDEATSAVDSKTEASVQRALRALSAGRTVFTVAHRLSTVVNADLILVMEKGVVVERGTHGELLALGGRYTRLWGMQTAHSRGEEAALDDGVEGGK